MTPEVYERMHQLFAQLQTARNMNFVRDIDALVICYDSIMLSAKNLIALSKASTLDPNTVKLYVRFDPSVSVSKIRNIQEYVEKKFGLYCKICDWSVPTRLDISIDINI